jgi:hypothetical protein
MRKVRAKRIKSVSKKHNGWEKISIAMADLSPAFLADSPRTGQALDKDPRLRQEKEVSFLVRLHPRPTDATQALQKHAQCT